LFAIIVDARPARKRGAAIGRYSGTLAQASDPAGEGVASLDSD